jgi:hypothetical protein
MNVKQLIELLQEQDPEAQVHYAYPSGDHWRTTVCPEVTDVEEGHVKHSDYHRDTVLVDEEKVDAKSTVVVVLS